MAFYLVRPEGIVVRREGGRLVLPTEEEARSLGADMASAYDLGGGDVRAAPLAADVPLPPSWLTASLREVFAALGEAAFCAAGRAVQVVEWAETSRHCGRCGTSTQRVDGERAMRCSACGLLAYPRIAPAMIVLVRRGEEALLAHGARFPAPFYSALAGFAEIGESLEETIAREVREEVGIEIRDPRYFGSQAWPFPHSLLVGFTAQWASGELRPEPREILDAKWFRPEALPLIPPPLSIARRLIDAWVEEVSASARLS